MAEAVSHANIVNNRLHMLLVVIATTVLVTAKELPETSKFSTNAETRISADTNHSSIPNISLTNSSISGIKFHIFRLSGDGGFIRGTEQYHRIAFVFTGHSFAEGGLTILSELQKHQGKASFFLTGDFLENTNFTSLVRRMYAEGHYLGPHSDKHVLYCPWDDPKKTLVTREEFRSDLTANVEKIERFDVPRQAIRYFLPPYEYYNRDIVEWSRELGLTVINYTPGTRSNADYTGEADSNFVSSQTIFDSIVKKEREDPHGLNGFILLLHIGSGPGRTDKFSHRFGELLDYLSGKGYQFVRVDELLEPKSENGKANAK